MTARPTILAVGAGLLPLVALGCSGPAFEHPLPSSPLLAAEWPAMFEAAAEEGVEDGGAGAGAGGEGVRARMIAAARSLLDDARDRPDYGYGARDLDEILAKVLPDLSWDASSGLDDLVKLARERGAYRTDAEPEAGDVVLFHNQVDLDANGEADDWLTGCAVVIEADGPRFKAVTRTGHAPREIAAWPDGPSAARAFGEKANSYVKIPTRADPKDAEYLASDLYAGYIDVEALEAQAPDR